MPVVRALDVDVDGIPAGWLAEHVRRLGAKGDQRLADGGYVIVLHRIASWSHAWTWRALGSRTLHLSDPAMRGTDVAFAQWWVGADDDGVYGRPRTERRVKRFQGIVELPPDGIVGPAVWRAMRVG